MGICFIGRKGGVTKKDPQSGVAKGKYKSRKGIMSPCFQREVESWLLGFKLQEGRRKDQAWGGEKEFSPGRGGEILGKKSFIERSYQVNRREARGQGMKKPPAIIKRHRRRIVPLNLDHFAERGGVRDSRRLKKDKVSLLGGERGRN